MNAIGWAIAAFWAVWVVTLLISLRSIRPLEQPEHSAPRTDAPPPRVSIVLAARDEAVRVRATVERVLAQTGLELEVVAVDDRSSDGTSEILDDLATRNDRLRVVHVESLPDGWLGKNWACRVAAEKAQGDWILFTDADAWAAPDLVARAINAAEQDRADHVVVVPSETEATLPARAALVTFFLAGAPAIALVNRDLWRGPMGAGAFNLVRRKAYETIGGHDALRFEVVDDAKLGLLLLRAGFRSRMYAAPGDLEVHWARTVPGFVRAFEKNLFAIFGYRLWLALPASLVPIALWVLTIALPFTGTAGGIAAGCGLAAVVLPAAAAAIPARLGLREALLAPLLIPLLPVALAYSTFQTLRRGGVRWRHTFYPLERLKRGLVR